MRRALAPSGLIALLLVAACAPSSDAPVGNAAENEAAARYADRMAGTPPPAPQLKPTFDVVVSNIISAILIRIAADVRAILNPGGQWITSGIIEQNWPDVLEAAEGSGFRLREIRREDGWVAAIFDGPL